MNKTAKWLVAVGIVILITFTAAFLINSYNKGDIGNKAEKTAEDFSQQLEGTWTGKYQISKFTFKDDKTVSLEILGVSLIGNYSNTYSLKTETHTVELIYKTALGISVDRRYTAKIDGDTLTLVDEDIPSIEMTYKRFDPSNQTEAITTTVTTTTTAEAVTETSGDPVSGDIYSSILGKWQGSKNKISGFDFKENGIVKLTLLGIGYNGTYTLFKEDGTGRTRLNVVYASVGEVEIRNKYYVDFKPDGTMTLTLTDTGVSFDYIR